MSREFGCEGCRYLTPFDDQEPCNTCDSKSKYEPYIMTNGDRIRAMSDEELMKIIGCPYDTKDGELHLDNCSRYDKGGYNFDCEKCVMDWLKAESEVKND